MKAFFLSSSFLPFFLPFLPFYNYVFGRVLSYERSWYAYPLLLPDCAMHDENVGIVIIFIITLNFNTPRWFLHVVFLCGYMFIVMHYYYCILCMSYHSSCTYAITGIITKE